MPPLSPSGLQGPLWVFKGRRVERLRSSDFSFIQVEANWVQDALDGRLEALVGTLQE